MADCDNCIYGAPTSDGRAKMCKHPVAVKFKNQTIAGFLNGYGYSIVDGDDKEIISINELGFTNGRAFWPVAFDPIWIECKLDHERVMCHDCVHGKDIGGGRFFL